MCVCAAFPVTRTVTIINGHGTGDVTLRLFGSPNYDMTCPLNGTAVYPIPDTYDNGTVYQSPSFTTIAAVPGYKTFSAAEYPTVTDLIVSVSSGGNVRAYDASAISLLRATPPEPDTAQVWAFFTVGFLLSLIPAIMYITFAVAKKGITSTNNVG